MAKRIYIEVSGEVEITGIDYDRSMALITSDRQVQYTSPAGPAVVTLTREATPHTAMDVAEGVFVELSTVSAGYEVSRFGLAIKPSWADAPTFPVLV